jgi:hypothetical protein
LIEPEPQDVRARNAPVRNPAFGDIGINRMFADAKIFRDLAHPDPLFLSDKIFLLGHLDFSQKKVEEGITPISPDQRIALLLDGLPPQAAHPPLIPRPLQKLFYDCKPIAHPVISAKNS